ncbi:hypothetical protein BDQ17DRAFT_1259039 [Cyathus striatus]|nr:hypothetical protein BDQ17DRAFT_1259039 [Cyathus striatus]
MYFIYQFGVGYQSELPQTGVPVCLLLWSDKAKVLDFGGRRSYPVIAQILNLPSTIHNSNGFSGGHIIGWLPIVSILFYSCVK